MKSINELIIHDFEQVLPATPSWVVVHSSLIHLNIDSESFKWQFLKKIKEYVNKGYTFAFTSFTFSFCKSGYFNKYQSRSETGILANWVFDLYDAIRTEHPIYSHVIIGKNCEQALEASSVSCFGEKSIYHFFEQQNATICMLGCGWASCTSFHYFEAKFNVPYRYNKTFISQVDPALTAQMYVRDLTINPVNNFMPAIILLNQKNKIRKGEINSDYIQSISFNELAQVCNEQLLKDIYCYVNNSDKVKKSVLDKIEADRLSPIKVAVLANNNYETMANIFKDKFALLCPSRHLDLYQNSYDQMYSDVYSGKIENFTPDYCFLPSRLEDLYKVSELEFANLESLEVLNAYIALIIKLDGLVNRVVFVHLFPILSNSSGGAVLMDGGVGSYQFIQQANAHLIEKTKHLKQVKLLIPEMLSSEALLFDTRQWYLARIPYSNTVLQSFASYYCGLIMNAIGKNTRLIILDLDNTLWGGVLGEEGISGISLGGDFPGNIFKDFQRTIVGLKNRGVILAIVSKNDEGLALRCIEKHPEMLIKKSNLAAFKINWNEKHLNITEIANELGLDYTNILFIDDNPVEREKVKKHLPSLQVLELPNDPVFYRQALLNSPYFAVTEITTEDKKRAENYANKRVLNERSNDAQNIDEFLASLKMEIKINKIDDLNFHRALQLVHKTNQFNTTAKRYSEVELKKMKSDPRFFVVVVAYADYFTEDENIGVLILERKNTTCVVDTFLLSCRVLGRYLENAIMAWLMNTIRQQGILSLYAEIVETPRNTPVRDVYKKLGFIAQGEGQWLIQTTNIINSPSFIKVSGNV